MIKPIVIKVVDKVPIVVSGPQYVVCDNSDYTVVWQLDEEWAQLEHRTMQVNYKDGTYERVLFTGDTCTLLAIPVSGPVHVGLFAGDIHTTRPARLLAVRSATTDSGEERDPMPDGYAQAIKALDAKLDKNQGADNAGKALVVGDDGNVVPGEARGGGSLPAMSSDTAGKMLTNDGKNPKWGGAVRYDVAQTLTDADKQTARINIGAFPGKTLRYFFDTTTGSKHDNDIFAAHEYDVISPGNTYSDGTHSNAGMEFPVYVMSRIILAQSYNQMRLLDNNGAVWDVIINTSSKSVYNCSKIAAKQVMCVNFTQGDDGNWSADKNYGDAVALIEAGGLVYATYNAVTLLLYSYSADYGEIRFTQTYAGPEFLGSLLISWKQDGTIERSNRVPPVLLFEKQTLTADEQAQARENIGAGTPYALPIASPTQLGGVKPVAKTDAMTQSIGVDGNGGLYTEPAEVYYIDLEGNYPDYTCPVALADIKAAYEAGKVLECRCAMGQYTATLPLFVPMPSANTWIFSGAGALTSMDFVAQSLTIAIVNGAVQASSTQLATQGNIPDYLPSPYALTITSGSNSVTYDGSAAKTVEIANGSDGLSPSEKNLILTLFESLPYTEDVSLTVSSLKKLWNGTAVYYPVTYNLTDVTAKNPVASVIEGGTLEVELEPDDGTEISSVSVTMSGTDITAAVYSAGRITIPSVSGAVVIAAVSAAAGFTPLEYLEGDGTAWINTGYSPSTQDLVEIKFAPTATAWDYVFSMYASSKATYGLRLRAAYSGTGTSFTRRGGGSNAELNDGVAFNWVYNTVYVLKETSPGTATIHNESGESLLTISDPQVGNFAEPTNPIFLWIRSNGTAPYGRVACEERIYSFKVVDAYGNAKLDLIPVLDGDGVACMYDKVSKRFLHDGTGGNTFIAGGQQ